MQVLLLAAGQSSRFYPFNSLPNKACVKLLGKTIIEHTLDSVRKAGIKDVVIVVTDIGEVKKYIDDSSIQGLSVKYVEHKEAKGMGAAILEAKEFLQESFFVLNAYHVDFSDFAKDLQNVYSQTSRIVLLGKEEQDLSSFGAMKVEGESVVEIVEKSQALDVSGYLKVVGIYLLNSSFLKILSETPLEHYHFEKALSTYVGLGKVAFIKTASETLTLKYPWDIFSIRDYIFKNIKTSISSEAQVDSSALISGEVIIENGARVMDGATIKGPCYIGKNVTVGSNSLIRSGVDLEAGSSVGAYIEVRNSIIFENSTMHSGFVGDSIIGANCKIGTDFCSANVRLDREMVKVEVGGAKVNTNMSHLGVFIGDNSRLGVRVASMPGIVVGRGVVIGPGTIVFNNIENGTTFYTRFEEVIKK